MSVRFSRRRLIQTAGAGAMAPALAAAARKPWPIVEGPDTPKLCLGLWDGGDPERPEVSMRRIKQLGVDCVLAGGPRIPWDEQDLRARIERCRAAGLTLYNLMISGFPNVIYGRPGRDEEIEKVIQSIRAAGRAGLPVIEYNFYAHRAMEGYYEQEGRAGAGYTAFDYDRMKDLPPRPEVGAYSAEELWKNLTYFLKAIVPEAEKAGVRLALHPNDPPVPLSRGSAQIMATLEGWKRLIEIVPSPANGITYDCGVTRELGEDPVQVCRYFLSRKRINHVHFRNVRVVKPYEKYAEVFPDEGQVDMFAVMKELVRGGYTGTIYPEHPRALDYDRERGPIRGYPGGGGYAGIAYNVAYARAMLQAALSS
ncbi:MAG: mannonate dehydratase [Bryobacterales bacterium]|nr:mannonate dehydratase [Bryobacteraceae bacterium]MDW8129816.1 mannonate dehydratase [Bryobacterales bacterium]